MAKCRFCEYSGRNDNVSRHEIAKHSTGPKKLFICECNVETSSKSALKRHKTSTCKLRNQSNVYSKPADPKPLKSVDDTSTSE